MSSGTDRLRIGFAVHDARLGGGQDLYALRLVNGLAERHDVTLFACSASGIDDAVRFVPIGAAKRPLVLRAHQFARRAMRLIERESFDIVHTVGGALPGANVITAQFCHAQWLDVQTRTPSRLMGPFARWYRKAETRAAMRQESKALQSASLRGLIGVSERVVNEWTTTYQVQPSQQAVVPNAVDADRFENGNDRARSELRGRMGIPGEAFVLLTVGTLVRKGIETAIACMSRLPKTVHLVAVGAGPHQRVHALARRIGVADRIYLVRPVSDIERYYHMANALLFPTLYEPFGMVVAEAWAAGLPVICSSTAGALEWSRHDETAIHIDSPTDDAAFAGAVQRLAGDQELAQRLVDGGRNLAPQFSWRRVVTETENLYRQIL